MCPNKKLQWFKDHGWQPEAIEAVRQLVIQRWTESYQPTSALSAHCPTTSTASSTSEVSSL